MSEQNPRGFIYPSPTTHIAGERAAAHTVGERAAAHTAGERAARGEHEGTAAVEVRTSARERRKPVWQKDFVT